MVKKWLLIFFLGLSVGSIAQDVNPSVWTFYNGRYDLNDKLFVNTEVHFRFTDGVKTFQQFLFRPQLSYILSSHFILSGGYSYLHNYPYGEYPIPLELSEHNVWEEVMIDHSAKKLKFSHRLRMEHRWLQQFMREGSGVILDGYNFANRFRYRLTFQYPIKEHWTVVVFDELFFSTSDYLIPEGLSQNWLFIGAKYKLNNSWSIQTGFQEQYLELGNGTTQNNPTWLTAVNYHLN